MHISIKQTHFHGHYFKLWVHFHNATNRRTSGRGKETYQPTTLPQPSPPETKCHNFPVIYPLFFTSLALSHSLSLSLSLPLSPCFLPSKEFQQIHVPHSTFSSPSHPPVHQILVTNDCCVKNPKTMELAQQRV
jgi:hypothetical protein